MWFLNKTSYIKLVYLCLFPFCCIGCGPGAKDGSVHISQGYYFTHLGGDQNIIEFTEGGRSKTVVKARVEDYLLRGNFIYVSRHPVEYHKEGDVLKSTLIRSCEYWMIDLVNKSVQGPLGKDDVGHLANQCHFRKS